MTLPVNTFPIYYTNIPSTGEKIKIRPFLAGEEKILLIAMQEVLIENGAIKEGSEDVLYEAIKNIVENCTLNLIKVEDLTTFDLDWLFFQLKLRSNGSDHEMTFICNAPVPTIDPTNPEIKGLTRPCATVNNFIFDLNTVKLDKADVPTTKIPLDASLGIMMKYPTFKNVQQLEKIQAKGDVESLYKLLPAFIQYVWKDDIIYDEFTIDELALWLETLSPEQFQKINGFFKNIPKLRAVIPTCCVSCGYQGKVVKEGLLSFLD